MGKERNDLSISSLPLETGHKFETLDSWLIQEPRMAGRGRAAISARSVLAREAAPAARARRASGVKAWSSPICIAASRAIR